ncbi:hypothetical protein EVAR_31283_1 [Eumeta japonica]|uniref:Uncharacterized protein n=1 Tax=Eumeta variegata TaxID=151549 RepID=A0A4C1VPV9_EUMVA|nr:hypothetical protein EVAR_31283_1 [Eumeta japonica]
MVVCRAVRRRREPTAAVGESSSRRRRDARVGYRQYTRSSTKNATARSSFTSTYVCEHVQEVKLLSYPYRNMVTHIDCPSNPTWRVNQRIGAASSKEKRDRERRPTARAEVHSARPHCTRRAVKKHQSPVHLSQLISEECTGRKKLRFGAHTKLGWLDHIFNAGSSASTDIEMISSSYISIDVNLNSGLGFHSHPSHTLDSDRDSTYVFDPNPVLSFGPNFAYDSSPDPVLDSIPILFYDSATSHSSDLDENGDK